MCCDNHDNLWVAEAGGRFRRLTPEEEAYWRRAEYLAAKARAMATDPGYFYRTGPPPPMVIEQPSVVAQAEAVVKELVLR